MTKKTKQHAKDYLLEYEPLKELYRDFSYTIKFLLENLLRKNSFKYQAITYREKEEESLKDKLETIKKIKSVKDIDDLAGCRIIFYLDKVEIDPLRLQVVLLYLLQLKILQN